MKLLDPTDALKLVKRFIENSTTDEAAEKIVKWHEEELHKFAMNIGIPLDL